MSWKFEIPFILSEAGAIDVVQDGRFIWITFGDKVIVYEFVGFDSKFEPAWESFDELNVHGHQASQDVPKLKMLKSISCPEGAYWIAKSFGSMWVTNKYNNFDKITRIDIQKRSIILNSEGKVIDCPEKMHSNLVFENGRLWMVSKHPETETPPDRQKLYIYQAGNNVWGSVEIPTRKQKARAHISAGHDGFIYVSNFNNVSISKFSAQTGAFVSIIRVNAFPQVVESNSNREIYVSSYGGMLSRVNGLTNEVFNTHSTIETSTSIAPANNGKVWFSSLKTDIETAPIKFVDATVIGRLNTVDNEIRFTGKAKTLLDSAPESNGKEDQFTGEKDETNDKTTFEGVMEPSGNISNKNADGSAASPAASKIQKSNLFKVEYGDWNIEFDDLEYSKVYVTKPFTYQVFNGANWDTVDVKPYLFALGADKIVTVRLHHEFMKEDYLKLRGTAMVSTGPEDYMGEFAETADPQEKQPSMPPLEEQ